MGSRFLSVNDKLHVPESPSPLSPARSTASSSSINFTPSKKRKKDSRTPRKRSARPSVPRSAVLAQEEQLSRQKYQQSLEMCGTVLRNRNRKPEGEPLSNTDSNLLKSAEEACLFVVSDERPKLVPKDMQIPAGEVLRRIRYLSYRNLARIYDISQEWNKAFDVLNKASVLEPADIGLWVEFGNVALKANLLGLSRRVLEHGLKLLVKLEDKGECYDADAGFVSMARNMSLKRKGMSVDMVSPSKRYKPDITVTNVNVSDNEKVGSGSKASSTLPPPTPTAPAASQKKRTFTFKYSTSDIESWRWMLRETLSNVLLFIGDFDAFTVIVKQMMEIRPGWRRGMALLANLPLISLYGVNVNFNAHNTQSSSFIYTDDDGFETELAVEDVASVWNDVKNGRKRILDANTGVDVDSHTTQVKRPIQLRIESYTWDSVVSAVDSLWNRPSSKFFSPISISLAVSVGSSSEEKEKEKADDDVVIVQVVPAANIPAASLSTTPHKPTSATATTTTATTIAVSTPRSQRKIDEWRRKKEEAELLRKRSGERRELERRMKLHSRFSDLGLVLEGEGVSEGENENEKEEEEEKEKEKEVEEKEVKQFIDSIIAESKTHTHKGKARIDLLHISIYLLSVLSMEKNWGVFHFNFNSKKSGRGSGSGHCHSLAEKVIRIYTAIRNEIGVQFVGEGEGEGVSVKSVANCKFTQSVMLFISELMLDLCVNETIDGRVVVEGNREKGKEKEGGSVEEKEKEKEKEKPRGKGKGKGKDKEKKGGNLLSFAYPTLSLQSSSSSSSSDARGHLHLHDVEYFLSMFSATHTHDDVDDFMQCRVWWLRAKLYSLLGNTAHSAACVKEYEKVCEGVEGVKSVEKEESVGSVGSRRSARVRKGKGKGKEKEKVKEKEKPHGISDKLVHCVYANIHPEVISQLKIILLIQGEGEGKGEGTIDKDKDSTQTGSESSVTYAQLFGLLKKLTSTSTTTDVRHEGEGEGEGEGSVLQLIKNEAQRVNIMCSVCRNICGILMEKDSERDESKLRLIFPYFWRVLHKTLHYSCTHHIIHSQLPSIMSLYFQLFDTAGLVGVELPTITRECCTLLTIVDKIYTAGNKEKEKENERERERERMVLADLKYSLWYLLISTYPLQDSRSSNMSATSPPVSVSISSRDLRLLLLSIAHCEVGKLKVKSVSSSGESGESGGTSSNSKPAMTTFGPSSSSSSSRFDHHYNPVSANIHSIRHNASAATEGNRHHNCSFLDGFLEEQCALLQSLYNVVQEEKKEKKETKSNGVGVWSTSTVRGYSADIQCILEYVLHTHGSLRCVEDAICRQLYQCLQCRYGVFNGSVHVLSRHDSQLVKALSVSLSVSVSAASPTVMNRSTAMVSTPYTYTMLSSSSTSRKGVEGEKEVEKGRVCCLEDAIKCWKYVTECKLIDLGDGDDDEGEGGGGGEGTVIPIDLDGDGEGEGEGEIDSTIRPKKSNPLYTTASATANSIRMGIASRTSMVREGSSSSKADTQTQTVSPSLRPPAELINVFNACLRFFAQYVCEQRMLKKKEKEEEKDVDLTSYFELFSEILPFKHSLLREYVPYSDLTAHSVAAKLLSMPSIADRRLLLAESCVLSDIECVEYWNHLVEMYVCELAIAIENVWVSSVERSVKVSYDVAHTSPDADAVLSSVSEKEKERKCRISILRQSILHMIGYDSQSTPPTPSTPSHTPLYYTTHWTPHRTLSTDESDVWSVGALLQSVLFVIDHVLSLMSNMEEESEGEGEGGLSSYLSQCWFYRGIVLWWKRAMINEDIKCVTEFVYEGLLTDLPIEYVLKLKNIPHPQDNDNFEIRSVTSNVNIQFVDLDEIFGKLQLESLRIVDPAMLRKLTYDARDSFMNSCNVSSSSSLREPWYSRYMLTRSSEALLDWEKESMISTDTEAESKSKIATIDGYARAMELASPSPSQSQALESVTDKAKVKAKAKVKTKAKGNLSVLSPYYRLQLARLRCANLYMNGNGLGGSGGEGEGVRELREKCSVGVSSGEGEGEGEPSWAQIYKHALSSIKNGRLIGGCKWSPKPLYWPSRIQWDARCEGVSGGGGGGLVTAADALHMIDDLCGKKNGPDNRLFYTVDTQAHNTRSRWWHVFPHQRELVLEVPLAFYKRQLKFGRFLLSIMECCDSSTLGSPSGGSREREAETKEKENELLRMLIRFIDVQYMNRPRNLAKSRHTLPTIGDFDPQLLKRGLSVLCIVLRNKARAQVENVPSSSTMAGSGSVEWSAKCKECKGEVLALLKMSYRAYIMCETLFKEYMTYQKKRDSRKKSNTNPPSPSSSSTAMELCYSAVHDCLLCYRTWSNTALTLSATAATSSSDQSTLIQQYTVATPCAGTSRYEVLEQSRKLCPGSRKSVLVFPVQAQSQGGGGGVSVGSRRSMSLTPKRKKSEE